MWKQKLKIPSIFEPIEIVSNRAIDRHNLSWNTCFSWTSHDNISPVTTELAQTTRKQVVRILKHIYEKLFSKIFSEVFQNLVPKLGQNSHVLESLKSRFERCWELADTSVSCNWGRMTEETCLIHAKSINKQEMLLVIFLGGHFEMSKLRICSKSIVVFTVRCA